MTCLTMATKNLPKTTEELLVHITSLHNDAQEKNRRMFLDTVEAYKKLYMLTLTPEDRTAIEQFNYFLTDKLNDNVGRTHFLGCQVQHLLQAFFSFPAPKTPPNEDGAGKDPSALVAPRLTPEDREFQAALTRAVSEGDVFKVDALLCSTSKALVANLDVMCKRALLKACLEARNADLAHMLIAKLGITHDTLCCHDDIKWGTLAAAVGADYCQAFVGLFDLPREVFGSVCDILSIDDVKVVGWLTSRFQLDCHDFSWDMAKKQPLWDVVKKRLLDDHGEKFRAFMQLLSSMMYHEFRTCFIVNMGPHNMLRQCVQHDKGAQLDFLIDHFCVDKVTLYRLAKEMVDPVATRTERGEHNIGMLKRVVNWL